MNKKMWSDVHVLLREGFPWENEEHPDPVEEADMPTAIVTIDHTVIVIGMKSVMHEEKRFYRPYIYSNPADEEFSFQVDGVLFKKISAAKKEAERLYDREGWRCITDY